MADARDETTQRLIAHLSAISEREDWPELERFCRKALSQIRYYITHLFLIHALLSLRQYAEADAEFAILRSYKFNLAERLAAFPLVKERYAAQLQSGSILDMMRPEYGFEGFLDAQSGTARWATKLRTETQEEFLTEAKRLLDNALPRQPPADPAAASICTFGSDFAADLSRLMTKQGVPSTSLQIEETVNSTFAIRVLMEVICDEPGGRPHADMRETFGASFFEGVRAKLRKATHLVLTVGVAPTFFRNDDKSFVFGKNYREMLKAGEIHMRTTTFRENAENLRRTLALMQKIAPDARRVITVSAVPLGATAEMPSVVIADCVSKATLRAVVHEVVSADPSLTYFPAFEIVRWLSGYTCTEVYGADDGDSRHVSDWLTEFIVASFIARLFAGHETAQ
jgi:hypothetical protein